MINWKEDLSKFLKFILPFSLGIFCERGIDQINIIFAGHKSNEKENGAVSIASIFMIMVQFFPVLGSILAA